MKNFSLFEKEEKIECKPFIKWVGGKGQLLPEISKLYPTELGKTINKYAEIFIGGGAVLFDILSKYKLDEVYISDKNLELVNTYKSIRDNVDILIKSLKEMKEEYIPLDDENRKIYYYEKRQEYNNLKINIEENNIEKASLFIFLNKTCFNGLYRVNKKGEFNVPMGAYKNPKICDEENLKNVAMALKNVKIIYADYRESKDFIDEKTFVYIDPPYRPLNTSSSFTSYTENDFTDKEQIELAEYIDILNKKGAKIVISNSDPKNDNVEDNFFDELYKNYNINRVKATRMLNSNASLRGAINELLITNYKLFEKEMIKMIKGGTGGANTQSGLSFEAMVDLSVFLNKQSGYQVVGQDVFYNGQLIAKTFKKYELYKFLCAQEIDWRNIISSQLLPDNSIYIFNVNTIFIIECKYQNTYGSVDEKLQTCDFKKKQYQKLMSFLGIKVEYFYLLNDWFREYKYTDVLNYINSVGCHYFFNFIPLSSLKLPE